MFKDEAGWKPIVEFVGLRAKLYSYKMLQNGVFNAMAIKNVCIAGRNNIEN